MKSVIAQGATISKAIEEALAKAGMPKEFFVKLLEEGRSGFLGFGATKAKIALFYKEVKVEQPEHTILSQSSYKNLFDNKNLQAQIDQQEKVEKGETKPVLQQPVHKERQPRRTSQRMHHRRPRKQQRPTDQQSTDQRLTGQRLENQSMDQQSVDKRSAGQRPMGQRQRNQRLGGQRPAGQRLVSQRPAGQRSDDHKGSDRKQNNQVSGEQQPKKEIKVRQLEPKKKQQDAQQEPGQKKQFQRRPRRKSSWGNDRKRSDKVHNGNDSDKE